MLAFTVMIFLILFAFVAGIVTILSPCILPVLPIILSSSDASGKHRPLGVVVGFIISFTFFTLFLSSIVNFLGIPSSSLRILSIIILGFFGLSLLIPKIQTQLEILFSRLTTNIPTGVKKPGFFGGIIVGLSLGLLWTPCVGPILASVISLALTGSITGSAVLITIAYSIGTAIPMFMIMMIGSTALTRIPWLVHHTPQIQKTFGLFMVLTSVSIYLNFDRQFQIYILNKFPSYGTGLTSFEDNQVVKNQLKNLNKTPMDNKIIGQPASVLTDQSGPRPPEFPVGLNWLNSSPLSMSELKGKVVLVDFWTYTCINCIRTLPHIVSWYEKYHDQGLVIIGVHTPEFEFEKDTKNVNQALANFGIKYPVVQDNDYKIWNSYDNHYWPAEYLIDVNGVIRHTHFGEGEYDITETAIQALLNTKAPLDSITQPSSSRNLSPESYLGFRRAEYFYPTGTVSAGSQNFTLVSSLPLHSFSYGGLWEIGEDSITASANSSLNYHFLASKVYLVLRPPTNQVGTVKVMIDGQLTKTITVDSDRLYTLFDQDLPPSNHLLQLEFITPGIQAFAFTFG